MHQSVMDWMAWQVESYDLSRGSVLEVGSWNVNGTVRTLFTGPYLGVDLTEGEGVDQLVTVGGPLPGGPYDTVVCTEVLEHDERPWRTVAEMARVLRPGGHLLLTARGYDERGSYELHNLPIDYWRFSSSALHFLAVDAGFDTSMTQGDPQFPGAFLHAIKPA